VSDDLKKQVSVFPETCGVYLMKDAKRHIIYVGKAKNLKSRVRQYLNFSDKRYQIRFLMDRVEHIDFIVTANEKDALLLENSLIKKHRPKYNVFLKDDKTYLGLKLSLADDFPKLTETRRIKNDNARYYGPFTSAAHVHDVKNFIHRFFMLRTCSDHEFKNRTRPCLEYQMKRCSAPCVNFVSQQDYQQQIRQVRLFLEGKNSFLQAEVKTRMHNEAEQQNFEEAARLRDLLTSMDEILSRQHITQLSFEFVDVIAIQRQEEKICVTVLMVRDATLIDSKFFSFDSPEEPKSALQNFIIQYYSENSFIPREIITPFELDDAKLLQQILSERVGANVQIHTAQKGKKHDLLKLAQKNLVNHLDKTWQEQNALNETLVSLQKKLNLTKLPQRIECYDISNISGKHAVGSMVTFIDAKKSPHHYKKFKIRTQDSPNDYAMLSEVLKRRFHNTDWPMPDLVLVDGGKGQLKQLQNILHGLDLPSLPIASIAKGQGLGKRAKGIYTNKKNDDIYLPDRKNPLQLSPADPVLMLLQNLRDEAHRFAITYHRQLRNKALTHSWLDEITGLGPHKKRALLKVFGSADAVKQASLNELCQIKGISKELAQNILDHKKMLTFPEKL